jgi:hypothetical protein
LDDVEAGPVGVVRTGSELMPPNHRSEFLNEWNRPNDLEDGMFVRLTAGVAAATFLVTAPRRQVPFGSGDRLKAMHALTAHLQQAMRTYGKIAESGSVNQGLVAMVDRMRRRTQGTRRANVGVTGDSADPSSARSTKPTPTVRLTLSASSQLCCPERG